MNNVLKYSLLFISLALCQYGNAQLLLPNFEEPIKLEVVNTTAEEIAPVPFSNGKKLYFVRAVQGGSAKDRKAGQEIWTSEKNGDSWTLPQNIFKEANDLGNNGVIGSSKDGNKIYVFNSIQSRRKLARGIAYVEKQADGTWGDLKKLKIDGFEIGEGYYSFYMNSTEDVLLISMAPNKNTLNEDLFVSLKKDGEWSNVQSLGSKINTEGVELSPFIMQDNRALYFASNGHGGQGGVDIFVSYRLGEGWDNWTNPKNLGPKINSPNFDAYFMVGNNKEVFFVSNRDSSLGDVYTTKLVEVNSVQLASNEVSGQFLHNTLPVENVRLEVYDQFGNIVDTVVTDEFGKFSYRKLNPQENYFLKVVTEDVLLYPDAIFYELTDTGEKTNKYVLTKTGLFVNANQMVSEDNIAGTFTYNNLPLENAYLLVYNESGAVVDTIVTDASGNFLYQKLNQDGTYTFKPLDIKDDEHLIIEMAESNPLLGGKFKYKNLPLQNEAILVQNEFGEVIDTVYTNEGGQFNYTKLKADGSYTFKPLNYDGGNDLVFIPEDPNLIMSGGFNYKSLPLQNEAILVLNEYGEVVDTIYTDSNGQFNYIKLKADDNFSFKPVDLKDDELAFSYEIQDPNVLRGTMKYRELPLQNIPLLVKDEYGKIVDTIYTDNLGQFNYRKLKPSQNYTFEMFDVQEDPALLNFEELGADKEIIGGKFEYKNLPLMNQGLVVLDENGFPVDTIYTDNQGNFNYTKLKGDNNYTIKLLTEEDFDLNDLVLLEEKEPVKDKLVNTAVKEELEQLVLENKNILFEFNIAEISSEGKRVLDGIVRDKNKLNQVTIEGHTDDVGTEAQNMIVAKMRVESVFNYLVNSGFSTTKLVRRPVGETSPIVSNSTEKGRAKNRRVTLLLK